MNGHGNVLEKSWKSFEILSMKICGNPGRSIYEYLGVCRRISECLGAFRSI